MRGSPREFAKGDAMLHGYSESVTTSANSNMFRTALSQSTRSLGRLSLSRPAFAHANARLATPLCLWRAGYASQAGLSQADVQKRVLEVMKTFEKVDPTKVRV
jgi:hypothetical protein